MTFAGKFVAVVAFGNDVLILETVEALRENSWIDTWYSALYLAVALGTFGDFTNDKSGPFLADYMRCGVDTTNFRHKILYFL